MAVTFIYGRIGTYSNTPQVIYQVPNNKRAKIKLFFNFVERLSTIALQINQVLVYYPSGDNFDNVVVANFLFVGNPPTSATPLPESLTTLHLNPGDTLSVWSRNSGLIDLSYEIIEEDV